MRQITTLRARLPTVHGSSHVSNAAVSIVHPGSFGISIGTSMLPDGRSWKADLRPPHEAMPGDRILDYRLEKKLGQGATGAVHKAYVIRGPLRGKTVAIKTVRNVP